MEGGGGAASPLDLWSQQIKSVDGFVYFRLSYFDWSDLQLFAISMAEELVGSQSVQIVSKRKQNPLLKLACICTISNYLKCLVYSIVLGYMVCSKLTGPQK